MAIEIAILVVGLVVIGFAVSRVMARERPAIREEVPPKPARSPFGRPHYVARLPRHFALPPVTIETLPINFKERPELVPPIDRSVLAALVASGSRAAAEVPRPEQLARGSIPPGYGETSDPLDDDASDLDDCAETLQSGSDLDDDAMTRTKMSPVV